MLTEAKLFPGLPGQEGVMKERPRGVEEGRVLCWGLGGGGDTLGSEKPVWPVSVLPEAWRLGWGRKGETCSR